MDKHQPTLKDAATDLRRCIYASFSPEGIENETFKTFYQHAQKIIEKQKDQLDPQIKEIIEIRLYKDPKDKKLYKIREDLLLSANLLQSV